MKAFTIALLFLLAPVAFGIATASAAMLKSNVVVEGEYVRLGDLFEGAGTYAQTNVAQAPAPGRRAVFDAGWLGELARAYRVAWRPQSRFDRVVVERSGRTIGAAEIAARLHQALTADGIRGGTQVELSNRAMEINIALEAPTNLDVRNLSYDSSSGRFTALVIAGGDHPSAQRVIVSGRTYQMVSVPVPRHAINPGEVIRRQDLEWVEVREEQTRRDVITDAKRLVGTTPRQRLRVGEPVRENETRPPIVVARNSAVTIRLQSGNMTLTAQGRAVDDGAMGDVIRVVNAQSKRTIDAVVAGSDLVTLALAPQLAAN
ncbi:MAG: flagellar basal body P-ring formation protein FlgA [Proteobacteria bacterium]|nr:flagellar basal body P-ring formation protein FlgA [Pseudomonadota bacterium]